MDPLTKQILTEFGRLNRKTYFDDKVILELDESNTRLLKVTLTPQDGLFAGTSVPFDFEFTDDYPTSAPLVQARKVLYHSNISDDGSVCFNMLSEPQEGYRMEHYINGLLWLLDNQNFNSQLNGYVTTEKPLFKVNHHLALRGYLISGIQWDDILLTRSKDSDRKPLNELLALTQLKTKGEINVEELASSFEDRGHFKFLKDQVKPVALASESGNKDIKFIFTSSNCTHVNARAKHASVTPAEVLKEMVLLIDDKASLLITSGPENIDLEKLSASLKLKVELPKAGDLKRSGIANVYEVSLFDWTGPFYVDEKVEKAPSLVASTGYPRLLARGSAETLLKLVKDQDKLMYITVPRVAVPTSAEPPVEPPVAVVEVAVIEPAVVVAEAAVVGVEVEREVEVGVVPAVSENDKEVAKREGSLSAGDGKKDKKLAVDHPISCRVPSDDATVKMSVQLN